MRIGGNAYGSSGIQAPTASETGYCTTQDLEYRIGAAILIQLAQDTTTSGAVNPAIVAALIAEADALIDSKVGSYYTVPFTTVPEVIKNLSVEISCYLAIQRRSFNTAMPKDWQTIYDNAMETLDALGSGMLKLPSTATIASTVSEMNTDRAGEIDFNDDDSLLSDF